MILTYSLCSVTSWDDELEAFVRKHFCTECFAMRLALLPCGIGNGPGRRAGAVPTIMVVCVDGQKRQERNTVSASVHRAPKCPIG